MGNVALGIDLGTSNSCVAVVTPEGPRLLANEQGQVIHASVVAFGDQGQVLVGNNAKKRLAIDPANTVGSVKRLIGRSYLSGEVRKARETSPYVIEEGPSNSVRVRAAGRSYSVPEVSALILKEMRRIAETALQTTVDAAVITVPAYFNDQQRQATRAAGRIAGLNVLRIINEPTAAALAYGFGKQLHERLAVYDLGGGTFDISVLEIGNDVFEVLSTAGDTFLGGDDFDRRLVDWIADGFAQEHDFDLRRDPNALAAVTALAEWGKQQFAQQQEVRFQINNFYKDPSGRVHSLDASLDRGAFQQLTMDLIQRTFQVCDEAMRSASLDPRAVEGVILVGGSTRLPMVTTVVEHYFGRKPVASINPEQVVALGAALQADNLVNSTTQTMLLDVTPLTLRIEIAGGLTAPIIDRNTPVPIERTRAFTTTEDHQKRVKIRVLQGESNRATECTLLGEFEFSGFEQALRGQVTIEVTFEIDANGIVNVSARDAKTGKTATEVIHLSGGMSNDEIEASRERTRDTQVGLSPFE